MTGDYKERDKNFAGKIEKETIEPKYAVSGKGRYVLEDPIERDRPDLPVHEI